jgi:hypothetical protein
MSNQVPAHLLRAPGFSARKCGLGPGGRSILTQPVRKANRQFPRSGLPFNHSARNPVPTDLRDDLSLLSESAQIMFVTLSANLAEERMQCT